MTADQEDVEEAADGYERVDRLIDELRPLSEWITGTLRITFSQGAVMERRVSAATARQVARQQSGERGPDELMWHSLRWFQLSPRKVASLEFDLAPDAGLPTTRTERERLTANGFSGGALLALVDLWEGRREPHYSARALRALQTCAMDVPAQFDLLAETLEGQRGVELMDSARRLGLAEIPGTGLQLRRQDRRTPSEGPSDSEPAADAESPASGQAGAYAPQDAAAAGSAGPATEDSDVRGDENPDER